MTYFKLGNSILLCLLVASLGDLLDMFNFELENSVLLCLHVASLGDLFGMFDIK